MFYTRFTFLKLEFQIIRANITRYTRYMRGDFKAIVKMYKGGGNSDVFEFLSLTGCFFYPPLINNG